MPDTVATPSTPTPVGAGDGKSDAEILNSPVDNTPATTEAPDTPLAAPDTPAALPAEAGAQPPAASAEPKPVAIGESMPEALRRASAADPAFRAEINRVWSQLQNYLPLGSFQELKALREKFPGGVAEAESIINDAIGIQQVDDAFYNGTPEKRSQLVADLYKDDPAALTNTAEVALQFLQKTAPADYAKISDGVMAEAFAKGQVGAHLQSMMDAVSAGKAEDLIKLTKDLYNWAAEKAGITKAAPDPRQAEFDRQRQELNRQRDDFNSSQLQAYQQSFNNSVLTEIGTAVSKVIDPLIEKTPVSDKAKELIEDTILSEIEETLKKDATYQYQLRSLDSLRRYDNATSAQRVKLTVDRASIYLPEITQRVFGEWTTNVIRANNATVEKKQTAASRKDVIGTGAADTRRQPAPKPGEIDYSKTSDADILNGNFSRRT